MPFSNVEDVQYCGGIISALRKYANVIPLVQNGIPKTKHTQQRASSEVVMVSPTVLMMAPPSIAPNGNLPATLFVKIGLPPYALGYLACGYQNRILKTH